MAKKFQNLTPDEQKEIIELEEVRKGTAEIAEGVFKKLFEEERKKMEGRVSKIIYGGIIATVLVLVALIASTWLFMNTYQQHYLDTQAVFNAQINDLRKENLELKLDLSRRMDEVKNGNDQLQRLMMERIIQTTLPIVQTASTSQQPTK